MTNREIEIKLSKLIKEERRITSEILELLNLADDRKTHLELGFSSLFDWLVRGFGYSESAAYRRIEAARLIREVPGAQEKLKSGQVNLTTLTKASAAIRAEEKRTGATVARDEVIRAIENKSSAETEKTLFQMFPESKRAKFQIEVTEDTFNDLKWVKDQLSHVLPEASLADVVAHLAKKFRTSAAKNSRVKILQRKCEYRDPVSGRVCGSSYQLQVDHIVPRALGGSDDPKNLRCLCRSHNILMAEKILGPNWANAWRTS